MRESAVSIVHGIGRRETTPVPRNIVGPCGIADRAFLMDLELFNKGGTQGLTLVLLFFTTLFACLCRIEPKRDDNAEKPCHADGQTLKALQDVDPHAFKRSRIIEPGVVSRGASALGTTPIRP